MKCFNEAQTSSFNTPSAETTGQTNRYWSGQSTSSGSYENTR